MGTLEIDEISELLGELLKFTGLTAETLDYVSNAFIRAVDTSGDGLIDLDEFKIAFHICAECSGILRS